MTTAPQLKVAHTDAPKTPDYGQTIDRLTLEVSELEQDIQFMLLYHPVDQTRVQHVHNCIKSILSRLDGLQKDLNLASDSGLATYYSGLVEELARKLKVERDFLEDTAWCLEQTASHKLAELTEELSKIGSAIKGIEQLRTEGSSEPHRLVKALTEKKWFASFTLEILVKKLSLKEHTSLFDQHESIILNLFDISKAIDRKIDQLNGNPQPPVHVQVPPVPGDLAHLRRDILKAINEKQLAKTILIYVNAMEYRSESLIFHQKHMDKMHRKLSDRETKHGHENDALRSYLARCQERLRERRDELVALTEEFKATVDSANNTVGSKVDLEPLRQKLDKLQNEPKASTTVPTESYTIAPGEQVAALSKLRQDILKDANPGSIQDRMIILVEQIDIVALDLDGLSTPGDRYDFFRRTAIHYFGSGTMDFQKQTRQFRSIQANLLSSVRQSILSDISSGLLRAILLVHMDTLDTLARDVHARDLMTFARWRRLQGLEGDEERVRDDLVAGRAREEVLDAREVAVRCREVAVAKRELKCQKGAGHRKLRTHMDKAHLPT